MYRRTSSNTAYQTRHDTLISIAEDNESFTLGNKNRYGNTYKMKPDHPFLSEEIKIVLQDCLDGYLKEKTYSSENAKMWAKELVEQIKERVKKLQFLRQYKIVCVVHVGQNLNQGITVASRSVWDCRFDSFVSESFRNDTIFAQASVFGLYYE